MKICGITRLPNDGPTKRDEWKVGVSHPLPSALLCRRQLLKFIKSWRRPVPPMPTMSCHVLPCFFASTLFHPFHSQCYLSQDHVYERSQRPAKFHAAAVLFGVWERTGCGSRSLRYAFTSHDLQVLETILEEVEAMDFSRGVEGVFLKWTSPCRFGIGILCQFPWLWMLY